MGTTNEAVFQPHSTQDEIALIQLGAALILAWPDIDAVLQRDLLNTAENISGIPRELKIRDIVDRFVRAHDTHPIK